jgi:hypothetical protein
VRWSLKNKGSKRGDRRKAAVRAVGGLALAIGIAQAGTALAYKNIECHNYGGGDCIECTYTLCDDGPPPWLNECLVWQKYYGNC